MDEEERRRRAIAALGAGRRPGDICAEFERSREWLAKWQRRFMEGGPDALGGQSRAPKHQARQTEPAVVRAVLAARLRLLRQAGIDLDPAAVRAILGKAAVGRDDVVDAAACLATARRIVSGQATVLPDGEQERDMRGLRMEIVA